ncbi:MULTISPECIES: sigma 54-interacting transcriptional regulator [unclassified Sphingobacterium]|uniref:sigma 54-interacting transcriptional regulator n=1 Tax=unclassified Sphingobacterium TaxID=2609468 RepID=UPI001047B525|nr:MULTISPECIES: sigma 54-interacting transcriptional regulator [unclassified Sphingobacterium]MCS3556937.1 DNA-binding NtrC family response regulator [Sphingobacterium sp. JUb21]TCQ98941.1 DNA-binding NtrC family response regulator [Sphingobacterium sp. JUb20]
MKILVSWLAFNNDFENGLVKRDGPTFNYHKYYFGEIDKHIILSAAEELDNRAELLASELRKDFQKRVIEVKYMGIKEIININMIKSKVEPFLLDVSDYEIDIFMSPGTPSMQIVWYLCHMTLGLRTNLFQLKELKYSDKKLGYPERVNVTVEQSLSGYSALIKEQGVKTSVNSGYKITESIRPVYDSANLIAQTDRVTTLIFGESGTGKEHLASYIHNNSIRKDKPFLAINCSAFTDSLLESRLFGYTKGAFTGADKDHVGYFEAAKGGTVFLDEIGDISPYMQQLLLRVIQEKKILRIGESKERDIDVRILAATNRDLSLMCSEGKFRWDLYYRLAVTELVLPPLKDRKRSEVKELLDFFIRTKKKHFKRTKQLILEKDTESAVLNYVFPGNVRELENLIENLYVFNEEHVSRGSLPLKLLDNIEEYGFDLKSVEKQHILKIMNMTNSNAEACRMLGITINTLKTKLIEYNYRR